MVEVHGLAGKGADARGDEHQPGIHAAANLGPVFRQESAVPDRQVEQDRRAVEDNRIAVDQGGRLAIGIDGPVRGAVLLTLGGVDRNQPVFKT